MSYRRMLAKHVKRVLMVAAFIAMTVIFFNVLAYAFMAGHVVIATIGVFLILWAAVVAALGINEFLS